MRGLYKADGRYHIDLRYTHPNGSRQRYVEHLPQGLTLGAARERARTMLNRAYDGTLATDTMKASGAPASLYKAFDAYLIWCEQNRPRTLRDRKHLVRMLKRHVPDMPLADISQIVIERFKRERGKDEVAPATINRAVAIWKHFVGHALRHEWIGADLARSARTVTLLSEPPGRVRYLTDQERRQLLEALRPDVREVVVAALLTGMRRGELIGLKKANVDLSSAVIRLTHTKNNRARYVPIHETLAPLLEQAMARSTTDYVFVNLDGRPHTHRLSAVFRRTVEKLGIRDLHFHDLRHDFATKLRRNGMGLDVIAALLGHTTLAMTQRYAHLGREDLREAVRQLKPVTTPSTCVIDLTLTQKHDAKK